MKRLSKDPVLNKEYHAIFAQMLQDGILEDINEESGEPRFYMPHRPVVRESSTTTKMRVMFLS